MSAPNFLYSYNITNRSDPFTWFVDSTDIVVPLAPGQLSFYEAQGMYDDDDEDYNSVDPTTFINDIQSDLAQTVKPDRLHPWPG